MIHSRDEIWWEKRRENEPTTSALVSLLIEKGLFTLEDWCKILADAAEQEAKKYEDRLGRKLL